MEEMKLIDEKGISDSQIFDALKGSLSGSIGRLKRVLLVPPDHTRLHSGGGKITSMLYGMLKSSADVMPALGTHEPMTNDECLDFFGPEIPYGRLLRHDWRNDTVCIGSVPAEFVAEASEGLFNEPIPIEVNRIILDKSYDLIVSIGQVIPHEVSGMANYTKNIVVGLGGCSTICLTHMLGAVYGMERIIGRDITPVRKVFDYAENSLLAGLPLKYVMTVTAPAGDDTVVNGLFIGRSRELFGEAAVLSREKNIKYLEKPVRKAVVYLDEGEFKSTWLGNKAVYRTRMAVEDGGEIVIIAPGVCRFGEDAENDRIIRRYGYRGRLNILRLAGQESDLKENMAAAAHLIHGSSDGRFGITYAPGMLSKKDIEGVNYGYMPLDEALRKYRPGELKEGFNIMEDGEEIFFVSNPALGLWTCRDLD